MVSNTPTPVLGNATFTQIESADYRLYQVGHLCKLMSALAGNVTAHEKPWQLDELPAESFQVVFGMMHDEIEAARETLLDAHGRMLGRDREAAA
ncbi:MAG: hypothetical protein HYY78_12220 [Betaproteobacteria bacterium]|nr:hypothetical protein [Betaproteobacteria bacterium]